MLRTIREATFARNAGVARDTGVAGSWRARSATDGSSDSRLYVTGGKALSCAMVFAQSS